MSSNDLKSQGNALFSAKKFKEAGKKYTEAIEAGDEAADPKGLAVLYANRAACRLSLKRPMDAKTDAKKATQLDPTYAKAFARLATSQDALGIYSDSKESWQRALDALPKFDLTPAEETQKAQYQAGLTAATAEVGKIKNTPIVGTHAIMVQGQGRMPWDHAAAILSRLRVAPTNIDQLQSSAWVIHAAYEEFMGGVSKMNELHIDPITDQMRGISGVRSCCTYIEFSNLTYPTQAIVDLTNGIMRDSRVIHFTDNEFISKYNKQMMLEVSVHKPWTEAGPEVVIREALARQRDQGWNSVRPSISCTVRAWIMRAVMDAGLRQRRHDVAVEFLKRTLDVLRSLRETWILVPALDRGVVFDKTFLFGIQHLYIDSLMKFYTSNPSPEILEDLDKESDLLIREVDEELRQPRSQEPVDPGFISSFYIYPRGQAYAMKGFSYNKRAGLKRDRELSRKAAMEYLKAADSFPQDDEYHSWFLNVALGNMFQARSFTLRELLDVMKRIRLSAPKAKDIWEHSSLSASGLWGILEGVGDQEKQLRDMLVQGTFTMDSCVAAEGL
ncbi:hypothetical protein B0H17DRAFT_918085 [Mycena rosella]|uniref:TPR-like protein n=1 Tax=Mycena rosella TaxID=1033263 RepID=A0AAD7MA27_MYCRO|nr:hypothetical protein B0H17DRAFT_918085 [Mycena rosella]